MYRQVQPESWPLRDAARVGLALRTSTALPDRLMPTRPSLGPARPKLAGEQTAQPPASLRRSFSWTLLGTVFYGACQCSLLIVLARLGGPVVVGQFALGMAVATPVFIFANLQLRAIQATDAAGEYRFGHYLSLRLSTSAAAFLVLSAWVVWGDWTGETAKVILVVAVARGIESFSELFYGNWQRCERLDWVAQSFILKGFLSVLGVALGVWVTGRAWGAACGLAGAWGLTLLIRDLPAMARALPYDSESHEPRWFCWQWRQLARLACAALPLGAGMLLISLNANIPRYFIAAGRGEAELGVFASMAQFAVAGSLVIDALGQSASPRLARFHVSGDREAFRALLARMLVVALGLGVSGVAVTALFGDRLLALVYGPPFARHADVFVALMTAAALWYVGSMFGYAATSSRRIRLQPVTMAVVVLASLAACAALVPAYGLRGAAWAQIVASAVGAAGYFGLVSYQGGTR